MMKVIVSLVIHNVVNAIMNIHALNALILIHKQTINNTVSAMTDDIKLRILHVSNAMLIVNNAQRMINATNVKVSHLL